MLKPLRLLRPTTAEEASRELSRLGESATVYAGGVELLLLLRHGFAEAEYLVDVKGLPGMNRLEWDGSALAIGAGITHRTLEDSSLVRQHAPLLAEAEGHIGNIRVRTQGTIGGNLVFADPHADPATALLIHNTTVRIGSATGLREMALQDFLRGNYEVALEPEELLLELRVPPLDDWRSAFLRFEQFYRPTLNVAAALNGADVRLAVGCIGPTAVRLLELEERLRGGPAADMERIVGESAGYLEQRLQPVSDQLGSTEYKLHLTKVLLRRALRQAAA